MPYILSSHNPGRTLPYIGHPGQYFFYAYPVSTRFRTISQSCMQLFKINTLKLHDLRKWLLEKYFLVVLFQSLCVVPVVDLSKYRTTGTMFSMPIIKYPISKFFSVICSIKNCNMERHYQKILEYSTWQFFSQSLAYP